MPAYPATCVAPADEPMSTIRDGSPPWDATFAASQATAAPTSCAPDGQRCSGANR